MNRRQSQSGFTLVELMFVVAIVAIMAAGIAPAITTALHEGRAGNAAVDLVRLGGRARSETTFTGLAHLLSYSRNATDSLGQFQLFRGVNNRCNMQQWGANAALVDGVLFTTYNNPAPRTHQIDVLPTAGTQVLIDICYQPDGAMLTRNGGGGLFTPANGGLGFTVTRSVNGTVQGVPRLIFFPYGGVARLDR